MICPYCLHEETKVTDKRDTGNLTRRRRECLKCGKRFSTHETVEWSEIKVIKKNGQSEKFDREKIKLGISKACEKRPVKEERIEKMISKESYCYILKIIGIFCVMMVIPRDLLSFIIAMVGIIFISLSGIGFGNLFCERNKKI